MGRWDPTYSDAHRQAISQAINEEGLSAPEVVQRAAAGGLAGLPRFDLPESSARAIASTEARATGRIGGDQARNRLRSLLNEGMDTLERQLAVITKHQREGDGELASSDLTRLEKILRIARELLRNSTEPALVFCSGTGRALGQRNVTRALRAAMRAARDVDGRPTFPALHDGSTIQRGALPNFHAFRHCAASQAIRDGEGAEQVSWMLGHRNSNVTRAVYLHEIRDAERVAERRTRMEARYGRDLEAIMEAPDRSTAQQTTAAPGGEVVDMQEVRSGAQ